jgi:hypothetical protein
VSADPVGPPVVFLILGFASMLASLALGVVGGRQAHVGGYVLGALFPILIIGVFRRLDLARRRSPYYVPQGLVGLLVTVLGVGAVALAAVHIWAIATDLAS